MLPSAASPSTALYWLAAGVLAAAFVTGCSGGDLYSVNRGQVAGRFLPTERSVGHHPDTLDALSITEEDGKIQYQLADDYQSLIRKWSCTFQSIGTGRSVQSPTYATLWSLELALASLQPDMGVLSLQKEKARDLIEKRKKQYFDTIEIEVYWFVRGAESGIITGPSARTQLHVNDSTYRPVGGNHGPLRQAFLSGASSSLYRYNVIRFPRFVDGTDVLKDASEIKLEIRRLGASSTEQFTWTWSSARASDRRPDGPTTAASSAGAPRTPEGTLPF